MRTLFLDHFYCVVPSEIHLALKNFFLQFKCADSYLVQTDHGTWNGIYVYPIAGGFLEFLEESERDPLGTHGIAFSRHGDETNLHEELSQNYNHLKWERHERKRQDGSTYYVSSYPVKQDKSLFLWGMEYFNDNGQKIRSKGGIEGNPIQAILSIELNIQEPLYSRLATHLEWGAKNLTSERQKKSFIIPQQNGAEFKLIVSRSDHPSSSFAVEIETDPKKLPKLEQLPEISISLNGNVLRLEYLDKRTRHQTTISTLFKRVLGIMKMRNVFTCSWIFGSS